jgi:predicted phosphodiesterase
LQSVSPNSVWVVWDTTSRSVGQVEFGLTQELGNIAQEKQASFHHAVQLTGLLPYTNYFYRINGDEVFRFRTAASSNQTNYQFVVFGDTRGGNRTHKAIVNQILKWEPDFVLHTGDLVESGQAKSEWDNFFKIEAPLLQTAPFYPTLGNHEDYDPTRYSSQYPDIFHLPGNELWYSFEYGNALFISLKADGHPIGINFPNNEQLAWFKNQLENNKAPWVFVFFHVGLFSSRSEDYLEIGMRERLVPLFEQYRVNAVFMGHHHSYERIFVNGITYIVTAGGGATLYELNQPEPESQAAVSAHHFVFIQIMGDHLIGKAIDRHGKIIDHFELRIEE